ncbi:lipoprotein [Streptomyces antibioticus]|uniref:lipoprotein n=1 Tax=Streptomyces antibioticus TaxID=1890 RepID=UPI0033C55748
MRAGVGNVGRGLVILGMVAGLAAVAGCSGGESGGSESVGTSASPTVGVAKRGASVGADGSACELPVTFDTAEFWKPKAVDAAAATEEGGDLGELADAFLRQGPVTVACEIDAKPAGKIGFLRVYTGEAGDAEPRAVLEEFVAAAEDVSGATYRSVEAGEVSATEVEYQTTSELLEETKKERALAVGTPEGTVILHLGGMDTQEHEAMLPAYELAKKTLHVSG